MIMKILCLVLVLFSAGSVVSFAQAPAAGPSSCANVGQPVFARPGQYPKKCCAGLVPKSTGILNDSAICEKAAPAPTPTPKPTATPRIPILPSPTNPKIR